jgi:hypothetical protein
MNAVIAALGSAAVVLGFASAAIGLWNQRKIKHTARDVQQVVVSVDGQMTGMFLRIDQLIASMQRQGATVPPPPDAAAVADAVKAKNGGSPPAPPLA